MNDNYHNYNIDLTDLCLFAMMTTNSKSVSDLNQMSLKRNLMLASESHIRSMDSEDLNAHMDDMIDSEKDDTNDDSETDSGSGSDGEESSGQS